LFDFFVIANVTFAESNHDRSGKSERFPNMLKSINSHGTDTTYSNAGFIDLSNPFFQSFGTNGRSCVTCHVPSEGWVITPTGVQERFNQTNGLDPLFRLNDGANAPNADITTEEKRRVAFSMLLNKENIRVGIGIPANADFKLIEVDDPYGYASETELSLFRRPLPTTNLKFLSAIMLDRRETTSVSNSGECIFGTSKCFASVFSDLSNQANHATLGHAEALQALTLEQKNAIVRFESGLFTAQTYDKNAGDLTARKAKGGPKKLKTQEFYFGINDTVAGDYQTHENFNPVVMPLYDAWNRYNKHADRATIRDLSSVVVQP